MDSTYDSERSKASTDDDVQSISRSSREQWPDVAETLLGSEDGVSMEKHRNMMLASLLEDYYRSRALDFLNATNPGGCYTRQSQEVEAVGDQLFRQARQVLSSSGLLSPRATSDESRGTRRQYLSGLDALVSGAQTPSVVDSAMLESTMRDLMAQTTQLNLTPLPLNDFQLTLPQPPPVHSHYLSSFREDRLLGRGGFGKVYQCYNLLDQKTYAVKKIALSPKLVASLSDGKHDDLQHVLREVKAMAMLDHPNIVRYHATWFEKPQPLPEPLSALPRPMGPIRTQTNQLLLDSHEFSRSNGADSSVSGGIVFGEDTVSHASILASGPEINAANRGWSEDVSLGISLPDTTSSSDSDLFVGGETDSDSKDCPNQTAIGNNFHALYIQMSMYPTTLAQFISPSSSPGTELRHCFHLAPTLRLILCILDGLRYIHSNGFIHRDIKPGNIFISSPVKTPESGCCDYSCRSCAGCDGEISPCPSPSARWLNPRIGDFGLVHELALGEVPTSSSSARSPPNPGESGHGHDAGTAYYQPPRKGEKKDEKIDIFALGVVLVEMLCRCDTSMERVKMLQGIQRGQLPPVLERTLSRDEDHDAETVEGVMQLVASMVEEDPDLRWSGAQVREALQDLLQQCDGL